MKKIKFLFIAVIMSQNNIACSTNEEIILPIQNFVTQNPIIQNTKTENTHLDYTIGAGPFVYFEDMTFKKLILNNFTINTNKDNEITFQEALSFTGSINVSFKNIKSIVGIERFENITGFSCQNNQLKIVDFTKNIKLEFLECSVNLFSEIDLSKNVNLQSLEITNTKLTKLNLSQNPKLVSVVGQCNVSLKTINIKNNHNSSIYKFYFEMNNIALECIQVDDINNPILKNWLKPSRVNYSTDCYDKTDKTDKTDA